MRHIAVVCVLLFAGSANARPQAVEVYSGPGGGAYQSKLYLVDVLQGATWVPSYVYQYGRTSVMPWHWGTVPTVNFTSFGVDSGPVTVRIALRGGYIDRGAASPKSKKIPIQFQNGLLLLTLQQGDKAWVTINDNDANPLFLFVNAPKRAVPPRSTYFGPGLRDISPLTGNRYRARSNETIYLDGGAWVRGNIDVRGATGVRIMGPGILSGELWQSESVQSLPTFDQMMDYTMIRGDWGLRNATVEDITIVAAPVYHFFGGTTKATGVKLLSPWFYSTDGFQGVNSVDSSFAFVGDNVFFPIWAGLANEGVTVTNSFAGTTSNAVFCGGYWGNNPANQYTALVDNVDVKTYDNDDWVPYGAPLTPGVFQVWVDNNDSTYGYANQDYRNIRIEGSLRTPLAMLKNMLYPWNPPVAGHLPLGNSRNLSFTNISLEGTQKYLSEIKGLNSTNGFHNVSFTSLSINGSVVTNSNFGSYFAVNEYVTGLSFSATEPCVAKGKASKTCP